MNTQLLTIKAKKFGVRLAAYRQENGMSLEALGANTGIPLEHLEKIERGDSTISLPYIELIALKLGIGAESLLDGHLENTMSASADLVFNERYAALRDRMIALILKKNRIENNISLEAVAKKCELSAQELDQYETGSIPIPWPILECLCEEYHLSYGSLISQISAAENHVVQDVEASADLGPIPVELRAFINNPANLPYLELAKRLSELDAPKLRSIAEGLLEITY